MSIPAHLDTPGDKKNGWIVQIKKRCFNKKGFKFHFCFSFVIVINLSLKRAAYCAKVIF